MALPSTLLRFHIQLSDVTRGFYETFEMRLAMHPSESVPYLVTRAIAYSLNFQEGIEFTQGISAPDDPAIWVKDPTGVILTWIDIGNPSARRLHKASKAAKSVRVYTYRDPDILQKEVAGEEIHRKKEIEVFVLEPKFLNTLGEVLTRDNHWDLLRDEEELTVTVGDRTFTGSLKILTLE